MSKYILQKAPMRGELLRQFVIMAFSEKHFAVNLTPYQAALLQSFQQPH